MERKGKAPSRMSKDNIEKKLGSSFICEATPGSTCCFLYNTEPKDPNGLSFKYEE